MLGALVLGADGLTSARRSVVRKALEPLEALALKVERSLENAEQAGKLMRAEKLAGLGLMAGRMAHALNNPLTAVLGFAELIVDTTGEARVKEDAEIIVREAMRIRATMEKLMEFWHPSARCEEIVDVAEMVREVARDCVEKLENRGVRLVIQGDDEVVAVKGDKDRLRQMMEHLLNNAAQALSVMKAGGEQLIRISVGRCEDKVHLVVSDTGPGFRNPARVFEPFDSGGLGLSVCYGIVHEHGGEISAFNIHPHGAAVAVELPLADFAVKKIEAGAEAVGESVSV
jgi:signal transduction histidine kinase